MAIARRAELARENELIGFGRAAAIARLGITDEAAARLQLEEIEAGGVRDFAPDAAGRKADFDSAVDGILDAVGCIAWKPPPAPSFAPLPDRLVIDRPLPPSAGNTGGWGNHLRGLAEYKVAFAALQPAEEATEPAGRGRARSLRSAQAPRRPGQRRRRSA